MEWLRWYVGCSVDPKFQVVARRSGQSVAAALAVWAMLLERASCSSPRGSIEGFDCESADVLLGLDDGAACAIVESMQAKGLICDSLICKWSERQPLREDNTAADRKRQQREREREARLGKDKGTTPHHEPSRDVTRCHGLSHDIEAGHEPSRDVTTDKIREEEKKRDLNLTPGSTLHARDQRGGDCEISPGESSSAPPPTETGTEPGIDFLEIREFYDSNARREAPFDGYTEFKQAIAGRYWPGHSRFYQAVSDLAEKDEQWRNGFAPGLAKFIRTRGWEKRPATNSAQPQQARCFDDYLREKGILT